MNWNKISQDVYVTNSNLARINSEDIAKLKLFVMDSTHKRIRWCAHQTNSDTLHEMLIVLAKNSYVRPHKHIDKSESFHVVEGLLDVVIFDEVGEIIEVIAMGEYASRKQFFYRISGAYFHSVILRSDIVVLHETTNGPLEKEDTVFSSWSPSYDDEQAKIDDFIQGLEYKINLIMNHE